MNAIFRFTFFAVLFLLGAISLSAQSGGGGVKIHKVKYGDTLYKISRKYKVELKDIRSLNPNIKGDLIHPNDEIVVSITIEESPVDFVASSGLPRRSSAYEWQDGHIDSLKPPKTRKEFIFNKENGDPLASKLIAEAFQGGTTTHTVLPGEDIYSIARTYHTSPRKIMERNPGKEVVVGTQLLVPLTKGTDIIVLSDEIKVRKLEPRHQKLTNQVNLDSERGTFELVRRDNMDLIYYVTHPSFHEGQKVYIQIPNNTGFIEAIVIGRLPFTSDAMIGISPRIYEIVKAAGSSNLVTMYFELD